MDTQSEKPTASLAPPNKAKMGGTLSVKKENAPEFSDKENEVLIRAFAKERGVLEANVISNKARDAAWQRITNAINAVSNITQRPVKDVKTRRKNIMKAYRQYKTELNGTGGGPPPAQKPFFKVLDEVLGDDCSVHGLAADLELGVANEDDFTAKSLESQRDLFEEEQSPDGVVREEDIPEDSVWKVSGDADSIVAGGSASCEALSTPNTFAKPALQSGSGRGVSKRKLAFNEDITTKASLQLELLELQRKWLLDQRANSKMERENLLLQRENLQAQRHLLKLQIDREEGRHHDIALLDAEERLNEAFFEKVDTKNMRMGLPPTLDLGE
ncbi:hypothetical protein AAVH_23325 [Aphelenchoides avenae]|nr:hypothetical protein AAVH_23325 [Aphelenchus avenae]